MPLSLVSNIKRFGDTPRTKPEDLPELERRFEYLQGALNVLDALARELDQGSQWSGSLDDHWERHRSRLFCAMLDLSYQAIRIPAKTEAQLLAKARIWLFRAIPEHDDDVSRLAESICQDIVRNANARIEPGALPEQGDLEELMKRAVQ